MLLIKKIIMPKRNYHDMIRWRYLILEEFSCNMPNLKEFQLKK